MFELAIKLIHIETQARVEQAYNILEIDSEEMNLESYNKGVELFHLKDKLKTDFEKNIFKDVQKFFDVAPFLKDGFYETEVAIFADEFFEDIIEQEREAERMEKDYLSTIESNLNIAANKLEKFSYEMAMINNYSDLLSLDNEILLLLINFEECFVRRQEFSNECIDGTTSGHHRDALDAYNDALHNKEFSGSYVYFDDDGELSYSSLDKCMPYMKIL
jgi:hypothetical protein